MGTSYLKACPFCGGRAVLQMNYSYKTKSYFVMGKCSFCGAQGKIYNSEEDPAEEDWENSACIKAASAWNKRQ